MTDPGALAAVALTGLAAGFVNALAGGGSLLSFPALIALGLPPLVANVTNTVALVPGYVGGAIGQRRELRGQGRRLALLLPLASAGGLAGGLLLLLSDERLFVRLVPWLLLLGSLLVALQEPLGAWLKRRTSTGGSGLALAGPAVALAAIYGGYFGAGLGVIMVAVLALTLEDSLTRLNGLKQLISLATNLVAALLFMVVAPLSWGIAVLMAVSSLAGGFLGGRLASRIDPGRLRAVVVLIGLVMSAVYFRR